MNVNEDLLLTPGPTNVPARVTAKMAQPMIHHRTKGFQEILARVNENLKKVFLTKNPVLYFASSGTGAMEASITNLLSPGDVVLAFSAGKWGERYRDIARAFGLDVKDYQKESGLAFTAAEVDAALRENPGAKAVLIALCETSTAVRHPVADIARVVSRTPALFFVDAISGLCCDPLRMDEWGIDVVVCGSQKGLMLPPGLAFLALNARAQGAVAASRLPKYYFHVAETLKAMKKNDTPFTPAVSLIRGLDEALAMLLEEGMENVWKRHAEVARLVRERFRAAGLSLLAQSPSDALTAVRMPEGLDSGAVIRAMRDKDRVVMADGQGELKGKIIRFAHMGFACTPADAEKGLRAFQEAMQKAGVS